MSRLEVYRVATNGDILHYGDARNSWGGAIHIWNEYAKQLHVYDDPDLRARARTLGVPADSPALLLIDRAEGGGHSRVWRRTGELPVDDQWVLLMTYDGAMVRAEDISRLAFKLIEFNQGTRATATLGGLIALLEKLRGEPDTRGACFNMTSVCANPWWIEGADEDDEGRPYNIDRDTGHWWVHEAIERAPLTQRPESPEEGR